MATTQAGAISVRVEADSAQFESSMDRAAASAERMSQRTQRAQQQAQRQNEAFIASIQRQVDTFGMSGTELLAYEAKLKGVTAQAAPLIERLNQMRDAQAAFNTAASRANDGGAQFGLLGKQMGMTAMQAQQLGYQLNDFFVQVYSGQAPLTALVQQGAQLSGAFGGIGGAIKAVLGLLTPTVVAIGALGGTLAALGLAYKSGSDEEKEFITTTRLTANVAGQTRDSVDTLARSLAELPRSGGIGVAREALQAIASTGRFTVDSFGAVGKAVVQMASVSGRSVDDVTKDFVRMTDGVAKWAIEANKQYHYATAAQIEYLRSLEAQGKVQDAVAENSRLLTEALAKARPELGNLAKSWDWLKTSAAAAWDAMKGVGKSDTMGQQLADAQKTLAELQRRRGGIPADGGAVFGGKTAAQRADEEIAAQQRVVDNLKARAQLEQVAAQASSKLAEEERRRTEEGSAAHQAVLASIEVEGFRQRMAATELLRQEDQRNTAASYERGSLTLAGFMEREFQNRKARLEDEMALVKVQAGVAARAVVSTPTEALQRDAQVNELLGRRIPILQKLAELEDQRRRGLILPDKLVSTNVATPQQQFNQFEHANADETEATIARMVQDRAKFIESLRQQNAAVDAEITRLDAETEAMAGNNFERQKAVAIARLQVQADKLILASGGDRERVLDELAGKTIRLTDAMQRNHDAATSFETGVSRAFARFDEEAANSAKFAERTIGGALDRTVDALTKFATTGKLQFGSLFKWMADEFIRNWVRMQVAQTNGGGGLLGIIQQVIGAFGGGLTVDTSGTGVNSSNAGLPREPRAMGGDVMAGRTYVVGERGPEVLHMGKDAGTITANGAGGGKAGNTFVTVENNTGEQVQEERGTSGQDQLVRLIIGKAAQDIRRGGDLHKAISTTYGSNRAVGAPKRG